MILDREITISIRKSGVATAAALLGLLALSSGAYAQGKDTGAYVRAAEYRQKMRPATLGQGSNSGQARVMATNIAYSDSKWEFFGPYNLQPRYTGSQGPTTSFMSGRVNSVAFDNRTQGIFYVAAASGGAWKGDSTLGTILWTPLGDKFPFPETSSVATDPTNGRILYVGLGDFYGPGSGAGEGLDTARFFGNANAQGIMKSVNGGVTFVNIGNKDTVGNPIMAGAAVSSIMIYPKNPRIVVASTGRGVNAGSLWRSTDGGATWAKPTLKGGGAVPTGDWNTVRVFNPYGRAYPKQDTFVLPAGTKDPQFLYASRINDGIYRSDDTGATWRRVANTPLNFNVAAAIGRKTLIVTPSATDPFVLYVMDTSDAYDDGRIYRGQPQSRADINGSGTLNYLWTEITGNYNTANGAFNNWSRSEYASSLLAAPAAFLPPQPPPAPYTPNTLVDLDMLYGGNRTLSASKGADRFYTLTLLLEPTLWRDLVFSHDGSNPPKDRFHAWQRDIKYDPFDPQSLLIANDGGVYEMRYDPDNSVGMVGNPYSLANNWFTVTNTGILNLNTSGDISGGSVDVRKQAFAVTQVNGADFSFTNANYAIAGTQHMGAIRFPNATSGWVNVGATATDFSNGPFANPPSRVGNYIGNTAIALTGGREYAWVIGPTLRLVMSSDTNWTTVRDISPDQSFTGFNTSGGTETHFPFPYGSANNGAKIDNGSTTQLGFAGQPKSTNPVIAVDTSGGALSGHSAIYTGTNAVWRYDPAAETGFDGTSTVAGVGGRWRQIGTTTFGGTISALAITLGPESGPPQGGQRIYAGTSTGQLWMTDDNARNFTPNTTGPATSNATWKQINTATLPGRPITSIVVNPAHPEDILVTLGGTGGGHVFRCQDTRASNQLYTDQSGLVTSPTDPNFFTRLPDVAINGIALDSQDPTNVWYVATDIGVFVTTDQGSTWQDATTPLGLPNVQCTAIKYVSATGYLNIATYGRGLWRIKTTTAKQIFALPNLTSTFTLNRIGNEIFAVVTITNLSKDTLGNPTGLAENVQINASSIVGSTTANTTTGLPVVLGAIAPGTSKSLTLRYPGTVGASGGSATFKVSGTYVTQTLTGPLVNTTSFPDVRTRLP